ncbi:MAG: winged helix-turn-helix domain-containing protein [Chloroflexota bacterium]
MGTLEFEALEYMTRNAGAPVSRDQILADVYGYDADATTERVDLLIRRLRHKLSEGQGRAGLLVAIPAIATASSASTSSKPDAWDAIPPGRQRALAEVVQQMRAAFTPIEALGSRFGTRTWNSCSGRPQRETNRVAEAGPVGDSAIGSRRALGERKNVCAGT